MKTILTMISAGLLLISTSCNKTSDQDMQPATDNSISSSERIDPTVTLAQSREVYFNGRIYTVLYRPNRVINDNASTLSVAGLLNTLYVIKESVPMGAAPRFRAIVSALPTMSFTSQVLWGQVIVTFTSGARPTQLLSADEITKMASMPNPSITLTNTSVYFQMEMAPLIQQDVAATQ